MDEPEELPYIFKLVNRTKASALMQLATPKQQPCCRRISSIDQVMCEHQDSNIMFDPETRCYYRNREWCTKQEKPCGYTIVFCKCPMGYKVSDF